MLLSYFIWNQLSFLSLQRVFESDFVGRRSVVKERFSKKYRHPSLDAVLTVKRLNAVRILHFSDGFGIDGTCSGMHNGILL